jgi:Ca2+-binding RTX toxin-like protein
MTVPSIYVDSGLFQPFGANVLQRNDDQSSSAISITSIFASGLKIGNTSFTNLYVNTNGNITFASPLSTYTPGPISAQGFPIIAPFWADVDTRNPSTGPANGNVYWDFNATRDSFIVTWHEVGYYSANTDKRNSFQLEIFDTGNGNFTVEFRYGDITWSAGEASGGAGGFGGVPARFGYNVGTTAFEPSASGAESGMLALETTVGNAGLGRWAFNFINGSAFGNGGNLGDAFVGSPGADSWFGFGGNDTANGYDGDDFLDLGEGADLASGGLGNDRLYGGQGGDILAGDEDTDILVGGADGDALYGGDGDDLLNGGAGADLLDGSTGWDTASYAEAASGVQVFLYNAAYNTGEAVGDVFSGIEGLAGSANADFLVGDFAVNALLGGGGNDWLDGTSGGDYLFGEAGNDSLVSRQQADSLDGGADFDFARYDYADTGLRAYLYDTTQNTGFAAGDTLTSVEGLAGSYFADDLRGDAAQNIIYGLGGADYIIGLGGSDLLIGGDGQDLFHFVGIGDGGPGGDVINDFVSGFDRISVTGQFFGLGSPGGIAIEGFRFTAGADATLATSQFIWNGATRQLFYDIDGTGSGTKVLLATLQAGATLAASDIIVI